MTNTVREYCEEYPVEICRLSRDNVSNVMSKISYDAHIEQRWVIRSINEGGYNSTEVDLMDILEYVKSNIPELLEQI